MNQRAVDIAPILGGSSDLVFGDEDQIVRARPAFQQIFERFADDHFTVATGNLSQVLELIEILLNEYLAHVAMVG